MSLTALRQKIVTEAHWVLNHGSGWHYLEARPVPIAKIKAGTLPVYTDCSGSVIGIYARAGAPDPSGYDYSGYGNTDSFLSNCEHIALKDTLPGDIVVVTKGSDSGSVHAYLAISGSGAAVDCFSHGGPGAPGTRTLESVAPYWNSQGYHFQAVRRVPAAEKAKSWTVLNGKGARIGGTIHPAVWAARHPKTFRKFGSVRFLQH